jgi:hypothetical protein
MTIIRAMIRFGDFRYRVEAMNSGSLRKRKPRSGIVKLTKIRLGIGGKVGNFSYKKPKLRFSTLINL